jgi:hypothetical protein
MSNQKILKALQIKIDEPDKLNIPIPFTKNNEIEQSPTEKDEGLATDFEFVKGNLKELIENGKNAMDGILKVASATDSPRAYEVVSLMLKTLSDLNKDMMVMHEKNSNIKKEKITNITNNSIYVGSTTDLQNLINTERSLNKNISLGEVDGE